MNTNRIWIAVSFALLLPLAVSVPMAQAGVAIPTPPPIEPGIGLNGVQESCTCQGSGRTASCSGDSCTCGHDWQGYPTCTATKAKALLFFAN